MKTTTSSVNKRYKTRNKVKLLSSLEYKWETHSRLSLLFKDVFWKFSLLLGNSLDLFIINNANEMIIVIVNINKILTVGMKISLEARRDT